MPGKTAIGWTEYTWNPVTGCDRVSPGCDHCYALTLAARLKAMGASRYQNDGNPATSGPGFGVSMHEDLLNAPFTWRKPRMVFVNSMSDLFHAHVTADFITRVFRVIEATPNHTYQILTKRPERAIRLADLLPWPPNLWMGVSVEDAERLYRIDKLRTLPAAVRFVSAEPLLGPLVPGLRLDGIDWVITGGESGPKHRPIDVQWVRDIRDLCAVEKVAFFHKQWGGPRAKSKGNLLDGEVREQYPFARPRNHIIEEAP